MLAFLMLISANYCCDPDGNPISRDAIFKKFKELRDGVNPSRISVVDKFFRDCKVNENFSCLLDGKLNRECLDFYSDYFKLELRFSLTDPFKRTISTKDRIYSEKAYHFMIVKSIYEDNLIMLSQALKALLGYLGDLFRTLDSISLEEFTGTPEWANDFIGYSKTEDCQDLGKSKVLLNYAFKREKIKTFMLLYLLIRRFDSSIARVYDHLDALVNVSVGELREIQLVHFRYEYEYPLNYILQYFSALSTWAPRDATEEAKKSIKAFAESHLTHYYFNFQAFKYLLAQPKLAAYSTLNILKIRIKENVKQNYLYYQPNHANSNLDNIDVYYANVDLVTDKEWITDWIAKYEEFKLLSGPSGARFPMRRSYRGVIISQCEDSDMRRSILADHSSNLAYSFIAITGILTGTEKVNCKQLIPELLQSGKHEHVARGLRILKYLATNGDSAIADKILKDATGGTHEIDCPICLVAIKNADDLQILPCGHFYHDHCIVALDNTDYSHKCPLCKEKY
eukprot:NODE_415_length_9032_cov_0.580992.p1 type:complete len:511 gc:universal NODE_415_length_9032_cov_0.580992:1268-2800(+)